ncbi:uncharacterized protein LOC126900779 [Daktulosphaira vitifoliae]|uniref:uncharacterized protein LOC126900779 n=1 Tax=Daktulosphaira vitifoliae TaxID=58002 RepID=UPI0021AA3641|nr:uncharacterized protein LOC126900779 [Daktulosphaira vitifoliae]
MAQILRVFVVLFVVICQLYFTSAQFDGFEDFFLQQKAPQNSRDPRENRGPVLFPATQPGGESSGVIVGASGFGFVPNNGNKRPQQANIFSFW